MTTSVDNDPQQVGLLPAILKSVLIAALLGVMIVAIVGCRSVAEADTDALARDINRHQNLMIFDHQDRLMLLEQRVEALEKKQP